MQIRICNGCRKPVEHCICSEETKAAWLQEKTQELSQMLERLPTPEESEKQLEETEKWQEKWVAQLKADRENPETYNYVRWCSFEVDDDIVDVIQLLWKKGYDTCGCCSGHPENEDYGLYIMFSVDYYFDFSDVPFGEGWSYARSYRRLLLWITQKFEAVLKRNGITKDGYVLQQRALLKEWAEKLPPARLAERTEDLPGLKIGSGKIPPRDYIENWRKK